MNLQLQIERLAHGTSGDSEAVLREAFRRVMLAGASILADPMILPSMGAPERMMVAQFIISRLFVSGEADHVLEEVFQGNDGSERALSLAELRRIESLLATVGERVS